MSRAKQRLRDKGIAANEVSASRMMLVPHTSLIVAPKGDPMFDPRSLDPVDRDLAADMVARVNAGEQPNTEALLVWERPDGLLVGDGHRRTNALRLASEMLGNRTVMALVEFFDGDEKAFLLARARRNDHDRFARRDKPSTLAFRVKQLTSVGATEEEIADACPKGITTAIVAALARWGSLAPAARKRFDDGAPLALLASVLEAPQHIQEETLDRLIARRIKSASGATRARNKARDERDPWARRMSPKQAVKVADALTSLDLPVKLKSERVKYVSEGLVMGLYLAANEDVTSVLSEMPDVLADAIREARAAKGKRA